MEKGRYCEACKIEVMGNTQKCPLCGQTLEGEKPENHWPEPRHIKRGNMIFKTQLLVMLVVALVSLIANIIVYEDGVERGILTVIWILLAELTANRLIKKVKTPLSAVLQCSIVFIALVIVTSFLQPMAIILVPFVLAGITVFDFIAVLVDKEGFAYGYFVANLCVFLISMIVVIALGKAEINLLWRICIGICLATIALALIVRGREIIQEIKNRLFF